MRTGCAGGRSWPYRNCAAGPEPIAPKAASTVTAESAGGRFETCPRPVSADGTAAAGVT